MARTMNMDADAKVFRAVITKKYRGSPEPFTSYEGPYSSESAARARVTFWKNHLKSYDDETGELTTDSWADGYVEQAQGPWSRV